MLGALGVVFGDIGTSPLYTVQTVFDPGDPHPVAVTESTVFGIISLIFWSVTLVVTVTYVLLVMRADNDGEGGIMALITLLRRGHVSGARRTKMLLAALGIFGASLFLGDGMITPAISVLSAVEGVEVAAPSLEHLVVPIASAILVVLFMLQRLGTATVGRLFGPIMFVWFLVVGAFGINGIASHPQILEALSPWYAIDFFFSHFSTAFFALAAVVLAFTGAEALYADMGHFGRAPITRDWLLLVFPACTLSYMGQGALILENPKNISNPFFLLAPDWAQWPLVFLATGAAVIASQAVVTGAFSVAHQAMQLGYLPRLRVVHTSAKAIGQIYVPGHQLAAARLGAHARADVQELGRAGLRVRHGRHRDDRHHDAAVPLRRRPAVERAALDRDRRAAARSCPSRCCSSPRTSRRSATARGCRCSSGSRPSRS